MKNQKHCDTCEYAYTQEMRSLRGFGRMETRQLCSSAEYAARSYTFKTLLEDWGRDHCRFWMPKVAVEKEGFDL